MSLFISSVFTYDEDAGNYIQAVETADAQALEPATRKAINNFVIGCKQDGIWSAIKASCILAGARTRIGALTPLVGTAPTSFNFVDGDYNRKTGLAGDGSTKYLNSNRAGNADPQNNFHTSVYRTDATSITGGSLWGSRDTINTRNSQCFYNSNTFQFAARVNFAVGLNPASVSASTNGLIACSRTAANATSRYIASTQTQVSTASVSPTSESVAFFAENSGSVGNYITARLAFYSIGESLDLARLDSRVTDLINAFAVTIP